MAGFVRRIRVAGFSGTAATTWAGARATTAGRSAGGGPSRDMSRPSANIASRATSTAVESSDRRFCTGPMTAERSDGDARGPRPLRIGISACLLGQPVRFDGGHRRDAFLTETFGRFVEWVPVCPEVECGFGTPREAMRLVRIGEGIRLVTLKT